MCAAQGARVAGARADGSCLAKIPAAAVGARRLSALFSHRWTLFTVDGN